MSHNNIHPIKDRLITKSEKEKLLGHTGAVFWLYGLSGSGKSTLVMEMEKRLHVKAVHSIILDGDNLRSGLNNDLGFSNEDRHENIRRVSEVAKILSDNGVIVLVSMITPFRELRTLAKTIIGEEDFHEIFVNASFSTCKSRDVKGLYAKVEKGQLEEFTGKSSDFEEPGEDCMIINSEKETPAKSANKLFDYILKSIPLTK